MSAALSAYRQVAAHAAADVRDESLPSRVLLLIDAADAVAAEAARDKAALDTILAFLASFDWAGRSGVNDGDLVDAVAVALSDTWRLA